MIAELSGIAGFRGAYTAGSTNWLSDDAELTTTSNLDVMVVLADRTLVRNCEDNPAASSTIVRQSRKEN